MIIPEIVRPFLPAPPLLTCPLEDGVLALYVGSATPQQSTDGPPEPVLYFDAATILEYLDLPMPEVNGSVHLFPLDFDLAPFPPLQPLQLHSHPKHRVVFDLEELEEVVASRPRSLIQGMLPAVHSLQERFWKWAASVSIESVQDVSKQSHRKPIPSFVVNIPPANDGDMDSYSPTSPASPEPTGGTLPLSRSFSHTASTVPQSPSTNSWASPTFSSSSSSSPPFHSSFPAVLKDAMWLDEPLPLARRTRAAVRVQDLTDAAMLLLQMSSM